MTKPSDSNAATAITGGRLAYGPNDLAEAVGVGRSKIFQEIKEGRLRTRKLGKRTIILQADALDWLSSLQTAVASKAA